MNYPIMVNNRSSFANGFLYDLSALVVFSTLIRSLVKPSYRSHISRFYLSLLGSRLSCPYSRAWQSGVCLSAFLTQFLLNVDSIKTQMVLYCSSAVLIHPYYPPSAVRRYINHSITQLHCISQASSLIVSFISSLLNMFFSVSTVFLFAMLSSASSRPISKCSAGSARSLEDITEAQLLQIAPSSGSCDSNSLAAVECRTAAQAAPLINAAHNKFNITTKGEKAALVSLQAFESGNFKFDKNQ